MPQARPEPTSSPVALFVFSNLREQKGGLTRAWLRRLSLFHEAGWETHVATIHLQPEIDETLAAWRERGWLPASTPVHHYQRRTRRFRTSWTRPTDEHFTRDDRIADWLDWLVGLLPGVVVFADSPVTYAPVAMMRNPYVGRIMTVHLAHRTNQSGSRKTSSAPLRQRSRYQGPAGQPKLTGRFLPYASQADAVVALTHRQAEHLSEDVPGLAVHVIPNIVDPPPDLHERERDRLRVVSMGRLDPVKRIDAAMRAVALARHQVPGLRLEVYGRGPDLELLKALRGQLGLGEIVRFRGFTESPYAELASARASLMTSRREGFGLAVAESLGVGTPVVTYDVDYGPAELVTDGVNGRVVADGDVEALAAALVQIVTDDDLWARLSAAGPRAVEHLAHERVASAWLDLAAKVAAGIPEPEPGLLVEDVRVRRAGVHVLGVAFSVGDRGPRHVSVGETAIAPGPAGELTAAEAGQIEGEPAAPDLPRHGIERRVAAVGVTLSYASVGEAVVPSATSGAAADRLAVLDATGRELPARGPGVPATVVPTPSGVVLVRPRQDGSLGIAPASGVLALQVTPECVEAELDGDVTPLAECSLLEATLLTSEAPSRLRLCSWSPGLEVNADAQLSLVVRTEVPRVVGSVRLVADATVLGPTAVWRGAGIVTWDVDALADAHLDVPTRLDLGITVGRQVRSVGSIAGPGRPLPVRLGDDRWVMATSSNGRLMLLRGRGLRTRAGWVVRRALPGRR